MKCHTYFTDRIRTPVPKISSPCSLCLSLCVFFCRFPSFDHLSAKVEDGLEWKLLLTALHYVMSFKNSSSIYWTHHTDRSSSQGTVAKMCPLGQQKWYNCVFPGELSWDTSLTYNGVSAVAGPNKVVNIAAAHLKTTENKGASKVQQQVQACLWKKVRKS